MRGTVVVSRSPDPLVDVDEALTEVLAHPIGSPPLHEMAQPGDRVCIVFTDITRASPDHLLVPAVLRELEAAGVHVAPTNADAAAWALTAVQSNM